MAERPKTYKKKLTDGEKVIKLAKERYRRGRDAQSNENSRFKANMAFTYKPGAQWPDAYKRQREEDGLPCLEQNMFPNTVNSIVNDWKMNTSGISVLPADDGADKKTAEILTGLIRNIETQSNAAQIKGQALGYAVAGNKGFFRVVTRYIPGTFEQEIVILPQVNTLSVTYDCDDVSLDGSGWKWVFIEEMISEEEFSSRYPDENMESWSSDASDSWYDVNSKKVRICEYLYKEMRPVTLCLLADGKVVREDDLQPGMQVEETRQSEEPVIKWCILGGNAREPLETREWAGQYIPVVPVWGTQIWVDGKRELYSALEYSHDAQRLYNYGRSQEAAYAGIQNRVPYIGTDEQFENHPEWDDANRKNYTKLTYTNVAGVPPPQRQTAPQPPSAILQLAANAAQDLRDTCGVQLASLGAQSNETSGRAINARAAQGDKATFQFRDNMNHADRYLGMILVDLIPKIIDTPRVVRTLGLDGTEKMQPVNQQVEEKDSMGNPISAIYDLGVGKYDVVISSGPSFNSLRQEGQQRLSEVLQGNPQLMQTHGDLLFKSMDFPYANELAERSKKMLPPELAPQDEESGPQIPMEIQQQMQMMQQQMQEMDAMLQQQAAALESKDAEYAFKAEELRLKAQELEIKRIDAESKRAQAMQRDAAGSVSVDVNADLSEADKVEIEIAKALRLQNDQQEHEKEMEILRARLDMKKQKSCKDGMIEIDDDLEEGPSEIAMELANKIGELQEAINSKSVKPVAVARDENGTIIAVGDRRVVRGENGELLGLE